MAFIRVGLRFLLLLLAALWLLTLPVTSFQSPRKLRFGRGEPLAYVPGQLIVRFQPGVAVGARAAALNSVGAAAHRPLALPDAVLARLPAGRDVPQAAAALSRRPEVLYAEPNWIHRITGTPNDPRFSELWGLHQASDKDIDAPAAWDITTGSSTIIVAVVDTGVAYDHPDLDANIWENNDPIDGLDNDSNGFTDDRHGWDFITYDNTPLDLHGHGTHVAGTIGARGNNGLGITGVNWQVSIMALRAGDENGSLPTDAIVNSFSYACDNGARVVNGSFTAPSMSTAIRDAVLACPNVLFVFAAGNEGLDLDSLGTDAYPCELHQAPTSAANVLCVGATATDDTIASFSNHGTTAVHLAAPGTAILSSVPAYESLSGFPDGFEDDSWSDRWGDRTFTTGDAQWDRTTSAASAGTHSLTDSPAGNYANDSITTIRRLPAADLSSRSGCRLAFDLRLDTEDGFDYLDIYAGATTDTPTYLGSFNGWTMEEFVPVTLPLGSFDGQSTVYVRLSLYSDYSVTYDGAYIDQFAVQCLDDNGESYSAFDGTSMATPHVAGVAALVLAQNPARTVANVKTAILNGLDTLAGLSDKTISGGRLNACKALGGSGAQCEVVNAAAKRRRGQVTSQ